MVAVRPLHDLSRHRPNGAREGRCRKSRPARRAHRGGNMTIDLWTVLLILAIIALVIYILRRS